MTKRMLHRVLITVCLVMFVAIAATLALVLFFSGPTHKEVHFLMACHDGDLGTVREMLEDDARLVKCRDVSHVTALHEAAFSGNRELVELLLKYGADVTARTKMGETVVDWAGDDRDHMELKSFLMILFLAAGG